MYISTIYIYTIHIYVYFPLPSLFYCVSVSLLPEGEEGEGERKCSLSLYLSLFSICISFSIPSCLYPSSDLLRFQEGRKASGSILGAPSCLFSLLISLISQGEMHSEMLIYLGGGGGEEGEGGGGREGGEEMACIHVSLSLSFFSSLYIYISFFSIYIYIYITCIYNIPICLPYPCLYMEYSFHLFLLPVCIHAFLVTCISFPLPPLSLSPPFLSLSLSCDENGQERRGGGGGRGRRKDPGSGICLCLCEKKRRKRKRKEEKMLSLYLSIYLYICISIPLSLSLSVHPSLPPVIDTMCNDLTYHPVCLCLYASMLYLYSLPLSLHLPIYLVYLI